MDLCYSPNVFRFLITFVRIFSVQSNGRIRLQPNNSTQAHNKNKNMLDYLNGCLEPLKQRIKQLSSTAAPPVTTADFCRSSVRVSKRKNPRSSAALGQEWNR